MVPLAPKLKVITYHFISYRRKSVLNLVEIQNTIISYRRKQVCPTWLRLMKVFI